MYPYTNRIDCTKDDKDAILDVMSVRQWQLPS